LEKYEDVWGENPAGYDYLCGASDEEGNGVYCENCDYLLHCDIFGNYVCDSCGREYSRAEYFNMIGADNKPACLECEENYPKCKGICEVYNW